MIRNLSSLAILSDLAQSTGRLNLPQVCLKTGWHAWSYNKSITNLGKKMHKNESGKIT